MSKPDITKAYQSIETFIEDASGKVFRENALANLQYIAQALNQSVSASTQLRENLTKSEQRVKELEDQVAELTGKAESVLNPIKDATESQMKRVAAQKG